jgi:hypothetical protein
MLAGLPPQEKFFGLAFQKVAKPDTPNLSELKTDSESKVIHSVKKQR